MKVIIFFLLAGFIISYVADKGNFKEKIQPKKNERIIDEFRWVDGGWHSDKDAKPVPEKKIIEMRKELQAQMDYLNQFY